MLDSLSDANQRQWISRDDVPNPWLFFTRASQLVWHNRRREA
jgi:hypothetical protein